MSEDLGSKKAVHVKWAGKTIALGTFPSAEADEKCARAKALTRAWRSTMRPKPSRDWVMNELERLGVRIVSGKLGRKADDEDGDDRPSGGASGAGNFAMGGGMDMMASQDRPQRDSNGGMASAMGSGGSLGGMPPASSGQQVNQHYEMLKLHHMNLLQELHETTMMMNMYQQQQLQQEQMRLQHAQNDQLGGMMAQRQGSMGNGMDALYGSRRGSLGMPMGSRGSLGLGASLGSAMGQRGSMGFGNGAAMAGGAGTGGLKRGADNREDDGSKRQKMGQDDGDN